MISHNFPTRSPVLHGIINPFTDIYPWFSTEFLGAPGEASEELTVDWLGLNSRIGKAGPRPAGVEAGGKLSRNNWNNKPCKEKQLIPPAWSEPIGSMYAIYIYMVTWIPSIYPLYVSIYTSTMDPMGYATERISTTQWWTWSLLLHRISSICTQQTSNSYHIVVNPMPQKPTIWGWFIPKKGWFGVWLLVGFPTWTASYLYIISGWWCQPVVYLPLWKIMEWKSVGIWWDSQY